MVDYKQIHIWNLPIDKVYVKFNKNFRKELFSLAHEKFGNYNLVGRFLNVKRPDTLLAGNWRQGTGCCPLSLMIKLGKKLGVSLFKLEKNIEEIKYKTAINKRGGTGGKSIKKPKLPITINEDFAEMLGHICGDGNIATSHPKKGITIGLKPIKPLFRIKALVNGLGIKTSEAYAKPYKHGNMWCFCIRSMRGLKLFSKLVGFKHPGKIKRLNLVINQERKFERYDNHEPKERIKDLLLEKKMLKTYEISKFLNRTTGTVRQHLGNMQKEGLLIASEKKGTNMWSLRPK